MPIDLREIYFSPNFNHNLLMSCKWPTSQLQGLPDPTCLALLLQFYESNAYESYLLFWW